MQKTLARTGRTDHHSCCFRNLDLPYHSYPDVSITSCKKCLSTFRTAQVGDPALSGFGEESLDLSGGRGGREVARQRLGTLCTYSTYTFDLGPMPWFDYARWLTIADEASPIARRHTAREDRTELHITVFQAERGTWSPRVLQTGKLL